MPAHTILVVDDEADVRESLADLLRESGYDVVSMGTCAAALAHLCQNPPPAAIVVDLLMPGMNAWELVLQLRRREGLAKLPVIAITGSAPWLGAPVPEAMVVRKPIDSEHLLGVIRKAVSRASSDLETPEGGRREPSESPTSGV